MTCIHEFLPPTVSALVPSPEICYIGTKSGSDHQTAHGRWVLHKDPCQCTALRLGGVIDPTMSLQQKASYHKSLDRLFLSEDIVEIRAFFECKGFVFHDSLIQLKQITRFDEMFRERRESSQEAGEGLRHRGNGRASGAGVQEQGRR